MYICLYVCNLPVISAQTGAAAQANNRKDNGDAVVVVDDDVVVVVVVVDTNDVNGVGVLEDEDEWGIDMDGNAIAIIAYMYHRSTRDDTKVDDDEDDVEDDDDEDDDDGDE
jgi:hypothetical protein